MRKELYLTLYKILNIIRIRIFKKKKKKINLFYHKYPSSCYKYYLLLFFKALLKTFHVNIFHKTLIVGEKILR